MDCINELPWETLIEEYVSLRKNAGFTQTDVGCITSTRQQAVARIENQERTPSIETFMKLLLPLGYTLSITPIDEIKDQERKKLMMDYYIKSKDLLIEYNRTKKNSNERFTQYFEVFNEDNK